MPAPANLNAERLSSSSLRLTWSEVAGANEYNVYRSQGESGKFTKINGTPVPQAELQYDDKNLLPDTVYWYKVVGLVKGAEQTMSKALSFELKGADDLNTKGMEQYKAGKYKEAEELFRQAIKNNPEHKYAYYNLACMLTLQLSGSNDELLHLAINPDSKLYEIKGMLLKAIELDPGAAGNAKTDGNLKRLRDTGLIDMWIGGSGDSSAEEQMIIKLMETVYWKNEKSKFDYKDFIAFRNDNSFMLVVVKEINPNGYPPHDTFTGKYKVALNGAIKLEYDNGRKTQFTIDKDGSIVFGEFLFTPEIHPGIEEMVLLGIAD
jgi:tetratricopeptide (TPR) repeat protein